MTSDDRMRSRGKVRLDDTIVQTPKGIENTETNLLAFEQEAGSASKDAAAGGGTPGKGADAGSAMTPATAFEEEFFHNSLSRPSGGRYRFEGNLVAGGMGAIHKVLDQDLLRLSAMKVMLPEYKNDARSLGSFITEAKITGFLEHPSIIPVHEIGFSPDRGIYFTMKLARGEALNTILNELKQNNPAYRERYSPYRLVFIFRKVCDALSFAHSRDIIHQDIKPHNIMVGDYGEVLLMDWGIAKYIGSPDDEAAPLRREMFREIARLTKGEKGQIKGTPTYMSPEQTMADPNMLDKQSDIFLLGSTLYHMMTLRPPYSGGDAYEVMGKAISCQYEPPRARDPGWVIPEEICRIIGRAMAFRKEDRYGSVDEMIGDIDAFLEGRWSDQERRAFNPGDLLMREGDTGEEAYLILSGSVEVFRTAGGQRVVLGSLKEGSIVGEMALIVNEARSASVAALEPTEVAVLNKNTFAQSLKRLPPSIEKMIRGLALRLIQANAKINPHLTEDVTYYVLQQLRLIYRDRCPEGVEAVEFPSGPIVAEIARNLGIAVRQVVGVLQKAARQNLVVYDDQWLSVPDIAELAQFIKFGRMVGRMAAPDHGGDPDAER